MNLFILTNFFWERTSNFQSQHKVMERAWTNFICIIKQIVILLFASWPGITIFRTIYITQLPLQQHTSSSSPDLPQLILPGSKTWPRSYKWYQACHAGLLWSTTCCREQYVLSLLVVMSSSISFMNLGADDSYYLSIIMKTTCCHCVLACRQVIFCMSQPNQTLHRSCFSMLS